MGPRCRSILIGVGILGALAVTPAAAQEQVEPKASNKMEPKASNMT